MYLNPFTHYFWQIYKTNKTPFEKESFKFSYDEHMNLWRQ